MTERNSLEEALSFHREGNLGRAADAYRATLQDDPGNLTALHMFGVLERDSGNLIEARLLLAKAEELSLDSAELSFDIGLLLLRSGEPKVAVQYFKKAVQLDPKLGPGWFYLGRLYRHQCEPEKAEQCLVQAVELLNSSPSTALELVKVELTLGKLEQAQARLDFLKEVKKEDADYWSVRAQLFALLGRLDDAIDARQKALAIDGDRIDDLISLARLNFEQGNAEEAEALYQGMSRRWPDNNKIPIIRADSLLSLGKYDQAWEGYSNRHNRLGAGGRELAPAVPQWNGEDVSGKRLVLTMDQGLGEQILFLRFIPELQTVADVVAVELDRRLLRLARRTFSDVNFVPWTKPTHEDVLQQDVDFHGVIGDFGRVLRRHATDFEKTPPFLKADPELMELWRRKIRGECGTDFIVGLSYASEKSPMPVETSVALSSLSKLSSLKGVKFLNLQYGNCRHLLNQWANDVGLNMLDFADVDPTRDLDEHAALILSTDLVVSVSTAAAHMSAGLGHPTWVLLPPAEPSFVHWSNVGGRSVWYPGVETITPKSGETWDIVADRLSGLIARR